MARSASRPIAERRIYYYWPLLDDDSNFIPQIRGESSGGRLQIGFRPQLKRLIEAFRHSGSLDGFAVALRNDSFDAGQLDLSKTFNVMLESVEVTALQRGCLR